MFAIEHKEKEKRGHPDRKPSWAVRDPLERHVEERRRGVFGERFRRAASRFSGYLPWRSLRLKFGPEPLCTQVSDGSMLAKRDSHSSNSPEKRDSQSEKRDSQSAEKRSRFHFPHFSRTSAASRPRGSSLEEEDVFHEVNGDDEEGA